jgi:glutaryl-CoA dehydrogenase
MNAMTLDEIIGWNPLLTDEERTIRDSVRRWVNDRYMPRITNDFEQGIFARELISEIADLGVLGANLEGYGCAGASHVAYGLACYELEAGDSGLRSFVSVQTSLAMFAIWRYGTEAQKLRWLPEMAAGKAIGCFGLTEPMHGSDPGGMTPRAVRDGDDWLITGNKMWITNAEFADLAIVWAKTGDDAGSIRGFIVEKGMPGYEAHNIPGKMSMRASSTGSLVMDEVRVPDANRLPDASGLGGPLRCLTNARYSVGFGVLGAASFCLNQAISYTQERTQFGVPLARKQLIQKKLADMGSRIVHGCVLGVHYGRLKEQDALHQVQVSLFKRDACQTALDAARDARAMLGANGITTEYHVIRHALNLESTYTYEGTHEIHTLALGRALTGESAF